MSYQTYTTEAIVLGSFVNNTADKSFLLFTKDAGMLYASARSVREERSRQRYALQDFSLIDVSLIKGKTGWRIGSVESKGNLFMTAADREARGSLVRLAKLARRYIQGENPEPYLYHEFINALNTLASPLTQARSGLELCAMVRLLFHLGYIATNNILEPLLHPPMNKLAWAEIEAATPSLLGAYQSAQAVSHLER